MDSATITDAQERDWARSWQRGRAAQGSSARARAQQKEGRAALERLLEAHEGLLHSVVRERARGGQGSDLYEDLCGAGRLALVEAAGKWDPDAEVRFGTYAAGALRRAVRVERDRVGPTTVPGAGHRMVRRAHALRGPLTQELGREPSVEELAEAVRADLDLQGLSEAQLKKSGYDRAIEDLEMLLARTGSALLDDEGDELHAAIVGGHVRIDDPVAEAALEPLDSSPLMALASILGADWAIFCARHGLDGSEAGGVRQTAARLGVPVAAVTAAEAKVGAALGNPAVQWVLWSPSLPGSFDDAVAADSAPSTLLAELPTAR